jgi:hypothetical protein
MGFDKKASPPRSGAVILYAIILVPALRAVFRYA